MYFRRLGWKQAPWLLGRYIAFAARSSGQRANNWALFAAGLIGVAADLAGVKVIFAGGGDASAVVSGLTAIGAAWVLIFVARLLVAPFRVFNDGSWHDDGTFVYHNRQLAFTRRVSPSDNDSVWSFRFKKAPPHSDITCVFEVDENRLLKIFVAGAEEYVRMARTAMVSQAGMFAACTCLAGRSRTLYVGTHLEAPSNPITVRVYVTAWHYQKTPKSLTLE